jgi:hypothetical protein
MTALRGKFEGNVGSSLPPTFPSKTSYKVKKSCHPFLSSFDSFSSHHQTYDIMKDDAAEQEEKTQVCCYYANGKIASRYCF